MKWLVNCLCLVLFCRCLNTSAQTVTATPVTLNYTTYNQLAGITPQSGNSTVTYVPPLLSLTAGLSLRANSPTLTSVTNPSFSIPISAFTAQLTAVTPNLLGLIPTPGNTVTLTENNQLIAAALLIVATSAFTVKFTTVAGSTFYVPPGTYEVNLTFSMVSTLGLTLVSNTAKLSVVISQVSGIELQNGGTAATMNFATPSDYINGVTLSQPNAMTAFSNTPYSISVKTSGISLLNGANFINVSNVNVLPTPTVANALITTSNVPLSLTAQNIVTSTAAIGTYNFNLQYSTTAGNTSFLNKPAGSYTTQLTYTITNP